MRKLIIRYDSNINKGGHNNIFFEIPSERVVETIDSYYLALDNSFMSQNESETKVLLILIKNLIYWIDCSVSMLENEEKYLPIDWSDQYTGFLILNKSKTNLRICYGVTLNITKETRPSLPGTFSPVKPIYHIEDWTIIIDIDDFIRDIKLCIKELSLQL